MIKGSDPRSTLSAGLSVDKTFVDACLSIKGGFKYDRDEYRISQSGIRTDNVSNLFGLNLKVNFDRLKWMRTAININGLIYENINDYSGTSLRHTLITDASFSFFPTTALDLNIKFYNYTNELSGSRYKNCGFLDAEATYRLSSRLNFKLKASNLLNRRLYSVTDDSGLNILSSNLPLRGREIIISFILKL